MSDPRAATALPTGRYGRPGPARRPVLVWGAAALVLLLGFLGWVAVHQGRQVSWQEITYDVGDPFRAGLTFQVTRPPGSTVVCTVVALNSRHLEVGRRDVTVPPDREPTTQLSTGIRAAEPAAAAAVGRCVIR